MLHASPFEVLNDVKNAVGAAVYIYSQSMYWHKMELYQETNGKVVANGPPTYNKSTYKYLAYIKFMLE